MPLTDEDEGRQDGSLKHAQEETADDKAGKVLGSGCVIVSKCHKCYQYRQRRQCHSHVQAVTMAHPAMLNATQYFTGNAIRAYDESG